MPYFKNGSSPSFCSDSTFNSSKIEDFQYTLEQEWPMYRVRGGDEFWKHEYEEHGTCATATFADEEEYFLGVLDLHDKYSLRVRPAARVIVFGTLAFSPEMVGSVSDRHMHA